MESDREVGSRNTVSGGGLTPARPLSQHHLLAVGELHLHLLAGDLVAGGDQISKGREGTRPGSLQTAAEGSRGG